MGDEPFCVPSPCSLIGLTGLELGECQLSDWCGARKEQPMTLNNIYSAGFVLVDNVPVVFAGTPEIIQNEVSSWYFRTLIIQTIPYVAVFIILFITLMITGVISVWVGLLLIVSLIVLVIVTIFWIRQELSNTVSTISTQLNDQINANWAVHGTAIGEQLNTALSVNVETLACTGTGTFPCFAPSPLFPGCTAAASPFCTGCIRPSFFCGDTAGSASIEQLREQYDQERAKVTNPEDLITLNKLYSEVALQHALTSNCATCGGKN